MDPNFFTHDSVPARIFEKVSGRQKREEIPSMQRVKRMDYYLLHWFIIMKYKPSSILNISSIFDTIYKLECTVNGVPSQVPMLSKKFNDF